MSTTHAKPTRPLRMNQRAQLVPEAQFARWHEIASAKAGLSELDRKLLDGLCEHHRRLHVEGYAGRLSIERMALDLRAVPRDVRAAVRHLVELCLVGVRPGAGRRASEYLMALPKKLMTCITVGRGRR